MRRLLLVEVFQRFFNNLMHLLRLLECHVLGCYIAQLCVRSIGIEHQLIALVDLIFLLDNWLNCLFNLLHNFDFVVFFLPLTFSGVHSLMHLLAGVEL